MHGSRRQGHAPVPRAPDSRFGGGSHRPVEFTAWFKEDASEVTHGYECGIGIENYGDVKEGDIIEAFEVESIAAVLDQPTIPSPARK